MGRAKNTLNAQDVSSTPIKVQYSATYPSSSLGDLGIGVKSGSNIPYSVNMSSAEMASMNNYRVIRQLYYQYYLTGSVLNTASAWDPVWQSTAASPYITADLGITASNNETLYDFPTGSGDIAFFAIPSNQFGEQIARGTFMVSSSNPIYGYVITDDGNGNLINQYQDLVGNIFYAQGIAVFTNPNYYLATEDLDLYETEDDLDIIIE